MPMPGGADMPGGNDWGEHVFAVALQKKGSVFRDSLKGYIRVSIGFYSASMRHF